MSQRVIVGFSGGVTSAEAALFAIGEYGFDKVVLLWHDTKKEDADTYRFLKESAAWIGLPITERSDGRSVEELELDEGALANNRMAFCSRILKAEQFEKYLAESRAAGFTDIVKVMGFTKGEWKRIQRHTMTAKLHGFTVRFPLAEEGISKQECYDAWVKRGVRPPRMYEWSDHANCINCRRGGKAYIIESAKRNPQQFVQLVAHEKDPAFQGHTIFKDGSLEEIVQRGLKRKVKRRESIDIGACECGS